MCWIGCALAVGTVQRNGHAHQQEGGQELLKVALGGGHMAAGVWTRWRHKVGQVHQARYIRRTDRSTCFQRTHALLHGGIAYGGQQAEAVRAVECPLALRIEEPLGAGDSGIGSHLNLLEASRCESLQYLVGVSHISWYALYVVKPNTIGVAAVGYASNDRVDKVICSALIREVAIELVLVELLA